MTTKVILSVDTEFSIAGAFVDPINNKPVGLQAVLCEKDGLSHGLGFILETLTQYDMRATFFVEALNTSYFGYDPMGQIARGIMDRGQDVQLHLHPCWQYFKNQYWQEELKRSPPNDDITRRSCQEIESILLEGLDTFSKWGLPKPKAIRTGSLMVNKNVYKAMGLVGINISSNVGVGIFRPVEKELELYSGMHEIENCYELPVLTYCDINVISKKHLKTLTITGSSWEEIEFLLRAAFRKQLDYMVILTHPSEFVKRKNDQYTDIHPNNINKARFVKLCQFLQSNKNMFTVMTFSDLQVTDNKKVPDTLLHVHPFYALKRLVENYANDRIQSY